MSDLRNVVRVPVHPLDGTYLTVEEAARLWGAHPSRAVPLTPPVEMRLFRVSPRWEARVKALRGARK